MATRVVYGDEADAAASSSSSVYATARAMTSPAVSSSTSPSLGGDSTNLPGAGQNFNSPTYEVTQAFIGFDTSGISGISSATLQLLLSTDSSNTDFTLNAYLKDWGSTVDTGDVVAGASLSGLTLVAHIASSGIGATNQYKSFTDDALVANINGSGFTRLLLASDNQATGTVPTQREGLLFAAAATGVGPKITLTDNTTQFSQTLAGGTTSFTPTVTGFHDIDLWGGGSKVATSASAKSGGGGGGYSFAAYNVPSLSSITVQVANTQTTNGTAGGDTWFIESGPNGALAAGAGGVSATAANAGGVAAPSFGINVVGFAGGAGAAAQGGGGSRGGSGAGSSGGTAADGTNGTAGAGSAAGSGGTAPTGGANGGNGGAGGGGAGVAGSVPGGGGGGGGSSSGANGNGGAGRIIVYWYVSPTPIIWIPPGLNSDALLRPFKVVAY